MVLDFDDVRPRCAGALAGVGSAIWGTIRPTSTLALVLTALLAITPPAEAQPPSHAPIIIQGDADLCDNVEAGRDVEDGIVNCDVADGSAEAPYLISGWSIRITNCPAAGSTCGPPTCESSKVPAALSICETTRHVVVRGVTIHNEEALRAVEPPAGLSGPSEVVAAGINLAGAANVRIESATVRAAGHAMVVGPSEASGRPALTSRDIWVHGGIYASLTADGGGQATVARRPVIHVRQSDLELDSVTVDATGRGIGIQLFSGHSAAEQPHSLRLLNSEVHHANEFGVDLREYDSIIANNRFTQNGVCPFAGDVPGFEAGCANLVLDEGVHVATNNTFEASGVSIGIQVNLATARIQHNRFLPESAQSGSVAPTAMFQSNNACSPLRFSYNDLNGHRVINQDTTCELNAAFNYWGAANGPAERQRGGQGAVTVTPPLRLPLADLPTVKVVTPAPGSAVHGRFLVAGTADPNEAPPLTHVEATESEDIWTPTENATGVSPWELALDATDNPVGPFPLWIRACAGDVCGVPSTITILVIERPLPPIALLEAKPRVAMIGSDVFLDASLSYSPHARPVAAYRFDLGNGVLTDWRPESNYTVRYVQEGEYPVSVEAMDADGLTSTNLPQVVVRIRSTASDGGSVNPLPGVEGITAVTVGLAVVAVWRRRT